jgi:thiol:disulfide interchange protein DsbD
MKKLLCVLLWLFTSVSAIAADTLLPPLPVDQAFVFSAQLFGKDTVVLQWKMAPAHYLYRDRLHFSVLQPTDAIIGKVLFPPGKPKEDSILGKYEVYEKGVIIPIPISNASPEETVMTVSYQGCSAAGYCYPPTTRALRVHFNQDSVLIVTPEPVPQANTQEQPFFDLLSDHHLLTVLLAFLGFGMLLSLTPCVLPMIPILSGIIVGHQKTVLRGKSFTLSLVYVLSMAVTYAIAGMLVGWLGGSVQAAFQQPWVIVLFSLLFALLALSFFGLYSLKLPAYFEERIANISRHQKSGHYLGVMIMGCLATLIVSPCVTPALVGVLGYISKTGNAAFGGVALFMLGLGMGLPLLLLGFAGGKFLPKAGAWMQIVEYIFGVLFLGMAIWMLDRLIPGPLALMLWSTLLTVCAVYLGALSPTPVHGWGKLGKGFGVLVLVYGFLLAVGAAQGSTNPLQPLRFSSTEVAQSSASFMTVKNLAQMHAALARAQAENKPVLVDFYADWCVSCKEMDVKVFQHAEVREALQRFVVLRVDVTANNAESKALMQYYQVVAPPTFLVFAATGKALKNLTRVGEMKKDAFLRYLAEV